jgi:DNA-binding transcriptional ArsR family regulator
MNPAIKQALAKMNQEVRRLETELAKAKAIRNAIEKTVKAPKGMLRERILKVLRSADRPLKNGDLRSTIRKAGYEFSLSPLHMTKQLMALRDEKLIRRIGEGTKAAYVIVK